jgi:hypothetical protein
MSLLTELEKKSYLFIYKYFAPSGAQNLSAHQWAKPGLLFSLQSLSPRLFALTARTH